MAEMDSRITARWSEIQRLVVATELDVLKNASGVEAAGVRARKGLRSLKRLATDLVKLTTELDKERRGARRRHRPAHHRGSNP